MNYPVDEWTVNNHSANGFRLSRSCAGQKLMYGQLMVICPHDGEHFLLAQVSWLMQADDGSLIAGVATLPGMPLAIGVQITTQNGVIGELYQRAFLLPALPAIGAEGSIVLPAGMYQASRVLEVDSGQETTWRLRMNHVLQRGTDFDRISYQML